ncbi:toll/interleukin-1 receptor domain-containing protein [Burkholderia multivorans]|uniref:toll/interleukin-1 receptor domain-containing protein n=1 Tax=Burkholderia multivorans TaxID=87883 RepID=UPI0015EBD877|nr:toll/interleukin-1 receptor domain-containing protein [Burkholderia multivorans]MBR7900142.1 toll/interleukin-1 receptor domain-containing protein [Burkholderia multivorans]HEM8495979.1 toll/interleukin-1 receptor domain-containing protein [Burkholderia multivorans]
MIFLSHNYKDKPIVEQFALKLREIFPEDEIFYDSWSIQPGDGIVSRMNEGLANCKLFLFFVSKNSLASKMVELEWQNAVIKATQGKTKIVPLKIDECMMPPILLQTLYIDLFGQGLDVALRQVLEVAKGQNTFKAGPQEFHNVRAHAYEKEGSVLVECQAAHFLEPISHYVIVVENHQDDVTFTCTSDTMCISGFNSNVAMSDGSTINGILIGVDRGTTPAFPVTASIQSRNGKPVRVKGVLHKKSLTEWRYIPFSFRTPPA